MSRSGKEGGEILCEYWGGSGKDEGPQILKDTLCRVGGDGLLI